MKVLLDTHMILWAATRPERLPGAALTLIGDTRTILHFSAASIWEIAIKTAAGREDFAVDAAVLRRRLISAGYREISISSGHAIVAAELPKIHKDPFDRMLVAQAKLDGLILLTVDGTLARYPGPIRLVLRVGGVVDGPGLAMSTLT